MNPERCDFLAGDELIQVLPRFHEPVLHLVCGDVGPLEAGVPATVPIWLALLLKKRHQCQILPPVWLCVEEMRRLVVTENEAEGLSPLPDRFFEVSHILVREAADDLEEVDQLKILIQDVWDRRDAKLRTSSLKFMSQHSAAHARMDGVQSLEIAGPGCRATLAACSQVAKLVVHSQDLQD